MDDKIILPNDVCLIIVTYFGPSGTRVYRCGTGKLRQNSNRWGRVYFKKGITIDGISCGKDFALYLDKEGKVHSGGNNQ